jgi:hypothetical protein
LEVAALEVELQLKGLMEVPLYLALSHQMVVVAVV